jgi:hypothetical protein
MRAVFIKGPSRYDTTRLFTDELAAAFTRRGHEAVVVDAMGQADLGAALRAAAKVPTDLVHTIGCLGDAKALVGQSLGELFAAPHVLHHVDYPLSHRAQMEATAAETAILTVDPSHVEAVRAAFGPDRFAHVAFCPHAAIGAPMELDPDIDAYIQTRPIPILFAGAFPAAGPAPWAEEMASVRAVFDNALAMALADAFMPALEALDDALWHIGEDPEDPRHERMRRYAGWVHDQVRHTRRRQLLDAAGAAGLPVFCIGAGFEGWIEQYRSFRLGPPMGLADAAALMRRARVVLNANANLGQGSHERPLTAMLAGAAVATDGAWWDETFADGRDLMLYRWTDLDAGLARLAALMDDPEATWRMGAFGQATAATAHRADHRVDAVIAAARVVGGEALARAS